MNQKGFTLIEILVALVLVGLLVGVAVSNPFSQRKSLEEDLDQIERGLRYMNDEAALKNTVVRLHAFLDKDPGEWAIEYGPTENFILPAKQEMGAGTVTEAEEEARAKEEKETNLNFNKISDFQEENLTLKNNVKFMGIASLLTESFQSKGEAAIYVFPGGEKDEALVILATEEEIATLEVEAFSSKIKRTFYSLEERKEEDLESKQLAAAQEAYQQWLKK